MDFDLKKVCKWIIFQDFTNNNGSNKPLEYVLASKVLSGDITEAEEEFIRNIFLESNVRHTVDYVTKISTPVNQREWTYEFDPASYYCPVETPKPAQLYDFESHWIYIHSPAKGRYDDTYWISDNCNNSLQALPTIKAFKEYDFEVGKFYKVKCIDVIEWGGNKKKYIFDIEESTEEEFMKRGFEFNAYDERRFQKMHMEEIIRTYGKMNSK